MMDTEKQTEHNHKKEKQKWYLKKTIRLAFGKN